MSRLAAVYGVVPQHRYLQSQLTDRIAALCLPPGGSRVVLERFHRNVRVESRHLALPLEHYQALAGFGAANDAFIEAGVELAGQAITGALADAGLKPQDVDVVVSTTVTGIAVPSLDARVASRLGLRDDVMRIPIFGLGCVAGASGLAIVNDLLRGQPDGVALLMAVELCSLTVQPGDATPANLVASGLFGDGAAAVVAIGDARQGDGPRVVDAATRLYPGTEHVMGWRVGDRGFQVVLSADVADVVGEHLPGDIDAFLARHDLKRDDIAAWVCHPGGPKVLQAVERCLNLSADALSVTWASLARVGNLSSVSVLHVLRDTIAGRPPAGTPGLLIAMGPGFCCQLVLLRW